jgi:Ca-activated chloride channel family protein
MSGQGIRDLKMAMTTLLDPQRASEHFLQAAERDVTLIIPFNNAVLDVWQVKGNDPVQLQAVLQRVQALEAAGGTDLYAGLLAALEQLQPYYADKTLENYLPAIVAMTDGRSDESNRFALQEALRQLPFGRNVPIHAIAFGDADPQQLEQLAAESIGKFFKTSDDLPGVLRDAKGYN